MQKAILYIAIIFLGIGIVTGVSINISAEEGLIPSWIKDTAGFWVNNQISDSEFISALQYLVEQRILVIPEKETQVIQQSQTSDDKSIEELLPTRDDIGTEWNIKEIEDKTIDASGSLGGINQKFTRGGGYSSSTLSTSIYQFDSISNVKSYYNDIIKSKKDEGGYKEVSINFSGSECYGTLEDLQITERVTVRCNKSNYYIITSVVTSEFDGEESTKKFLQAVLNKIN